MPYNDTDWDPIEHERREAHRLEQGHLALLFAEEEARLRPPLASVVHEEHPGRELDWRQIEEARLEEVIRQWEAEQQRDDRDAQPPHDR